VTGMTKEVGMVVGVEELLAMDVLKRIGSATMWENKFWSHHRDKVVALGLFIYSCVKQITTIPIGSAMMITT
jgi:hypothetical protein